VGVQAALDGSSGHIVAYTENYAFVYMYVSLSVTHFWP